MIMVARPNVTHDNNNNIKMDLQEVGFGGMDWIEPAQDRGGGHL